MRTLLWRIKTRVRTFSYSIAFTLRAQLNCIKLGSQSSPSWQWVMTIKLESASMVMTKFTGTINHLPAARSLIPYRMESEEGAGQVKNQQLLPLSTGVQLSARLWDKSTRFVDMLWYGGYTWRSRMLLNVYGTEIHQHDGRKSIHVIGVSIQ